MKHLFKTRLKKLEKDYEERANGQKKKALILCDSELPQSFTAFDVNADVVLIVPDKEKDVM